GCHENFGQKLRLLEAEQARLDGRPTAAMAAYDEAIAQARTHGFLHIEALAAQLCGEFHLEGGRRSSASFYIERACDAYERWNAQRAIRYLRQRHAHLLHPGAARPAPQTPAPRAAEPPRAIAAGRHGGAHLDIETATRSAQPFAGKLRNAASLDEL